MTTDAPGGHDENDNERTDDDGDGGGEDERTMVDVWLTAQHLSEGDTVVLNWEHVFEVHEVTTPSDDADDVIEYVGQNKAGMWRFLRVDTSRLTAPSYRSPDGEESLGVVDIAASGETILSAADAESLLAYDVTGDAVYDGYVDDARVEDGLEFADSVDVVGECPCGGRVGVVGQRVVCEDCGCWVERVVWDAWVAFDASVGDETPAGDEGGDRVVFDAVDADNVGGDRSLDEFE